MKILAVLVYTTVCMSFPSVTAATSTAEKSSISPKYMVSAAHPKAVEIGIQVLRRGGSAVDAAAAVQLVLNLVEPQSSGIGGGAFMLIYDASKAQVVTYDGRETAPGAADSDLFLTVRGEPMKFKDAVLSGRSVGAPGTVALLAHAHEQFGKLPWMDLFQPAIDLARNGFTVGERLASLLRAETGQQLKVFSNSRDYFFPKGTPLTAGDIHTNPAFADTLAEIAQHGPEAFYEGQIAEDIVKSVQSAPNHGGLLETSDLSGYQVIQRAPICHPYRNYRVCGMGPPSSGALTVGQILGIVENYDLKALGENNPFSWHIVAEASKLAFADRNHYIADSDFAEFPVNGMLDPEYLAERSILIDANFAMDTPAKHGLPPDIPVTSLAPDVHSGRSSTSHFSIVDADGNAVSMTTTIEGAFGSHLMTRGFLLNNELTDFSFVAEKNGMKVANRVEPKKRPRSSMSPTLVFNSDGSLRLVIGSPGGSRIIGYVAKTLIAVLDWGMDIQTAIELGHVVNRNGKTDLEKGTQAELVKEPFEKLGHQVAVRNLTSGLHGIEIVDGMIRGGADPRREGIWLGE